MSIKVDDSVVFKGSVIARTLHDPDTIAFRGVVSELMCGGKVAKVESDAGAIKHIPTANLAKLTKTGIRDLP